MFSLYSETLINSLPNRSSRNPNEVIAETMLASAPHRSNIVFQHNPYREVDILLNHIDTKYTIPEGDEKYILPDWWKKVFRESLTVKPGWQGSLNPGWAKREAIWSCGRKNSKTTATASLIRAMLECDNFMPGLRQVTIPIYSLGLRTGKVFMDQLEKLGPLDIVEKRVYDRDNYNLDDYTDASQVYVRVSNGEARAGTLDIKNVLTERTVSVRPNNVKANIGNIALLAQVFDEFGNEHNPMVYDTINTGNLQALNIMVGTRGRLGSVMNTRIDQLIKLDKAYRYALYVMSADQDVCRTSEGCGILEQWLAANPCLGEKWNPMSAFRTKYEESCLGGNVSKWEDFKMFNLNLKSLGASIAELFNLDQITQCDNPKVKQNGDCVIGLDLSAVHDFTAITFWWPLSEKMLLHCFVPAGGGGETLKHYEQKTGYPLTALKRRGYVHETGGRQIDFRQVSQYILQQIKDTDQPPGSVIIACDNFRMATFKSTLQSQGLTCGVNFPVLMPVQMGSKYFGDLVTRFRNGVVNQRINFEGTELLEHALLGAIVKVDNQLNPYFDRASRESSRIDPLISCVLAYSAWHYFNTILSKTDNKSIGRSIGNLLHRLGREPRLRF